jgi:tRNA(fMet)-specific endonuclease VapC
MAWRRVGRGSVGSFGEVVVSVSNSDLLLLDTNILVHWVRQDRTGGHLKSQYALDERTERPLFSTVSEGEIHGLSLCWGWGESKRKSLADLLNELVRFEASLPEVVSAYAQLYWEDQRTGRNTGENDLWIAASAKVIGAVLLTCDRDFLWLSPTHVRVEYIPEVK